MEEEEYLVLTAAYLQVADYEENKTQEEVTPSRRGKIKTAEA